MSALTYVLPVSTVTRTLVGAAAAAPGYTSAATRPDTAATTGKDNRIRRMGHPPILRQIVPRATYPFGWHLYTKGCPARATPRTADAGLRSRPLDCSVAVVVAAHLAPEV